ncbi:MAG: cytidine deaminase [Candidatus Devosia symbiotica]|nr:cytidine deaminase [Candidatus Devosia symbiotica]
MSHTAIDKVLFEAASAIRARSYSLYSNFVVGAAILADHGQVYAGCNIENAAFPQRNCAEVLAILGMISADTKRIKRIYVVGNGAAPVIFCGGCRQRIREFADLDIEVISHGVDGEPLTCTLEHLLPHSFGPDYLSK